MACQCRKCILNWCSCWSLIFTFSFKLPPEAFHLLTLAIRWEQSFSTGNSTFCNFRPWNNEADRSGIRGHGSRIFSFMFYRSDVARAKGNYKCQLLTSNTGHVIAYILNNDTPQTYLSPLFLSCPSPIWKILTMSVPLYLHHILDFSNEIVLNF